MLYETLSSPTNFTVQHCCLAELAEHLPSSFTNSGKHRFTYAAAHSYDLPARCLQPSCGDVTGKGEGEMGVKREWLLLMAGCAVRASSVQKRDEWPSLPAKH